MDIQSKACDTRTEKKHLFLDISSTNTDTLVRFEDFKAVTMKKAVFWDVAPLLHGATSQKTVFFTDTLVSSLYQIAVF
jgi:hypothetical protein